LVPLTFASVYAMSSSTVAQLQALLAKIQELNIQEPDPDLDLQISVATQAAEAQIQSYQAAANQAEEPAEEPPPDLDNEDGIQPVESPSSPHLQTEPRRPDPTTMSTGEDCMGDSSRAAVPSHSMTLTSVPLTPTSRSISGSVSPRCLKPWSTENILHDSGSQQLDDSGPIGSHGRSSPKSAEPPPPSYRFSVKSDSRFPFTAIQMEDCRPSDATYLDPNSLPQFGMPLKGVLPLEPPLELFVWPETSMSTAGKPDLDKLIPAPPAPKPDVGYYPQAPEYILNAELDRSYRRGWRYAAPFYTSNRTQERDNMLKVRMPPNVTPTQFDLRTRSFVPQPIPGMVRAPLGVPLVHQVDGDPKQSITIVCAHSLDTLMEYEEGPQITELSKRLMELTWGKDKIGDRPAVPGIFELDGMQLNLRSKHVDPKKLQPGDGSFNLASTHGEGEGHGHFAPAVQTNTPEAAAIIKEVLTVLHKLYRLIMPLCISRFEWDAMEAHGYENNVVAFGGLEPGPTSCQVNSSSSANVVDLPLPDPQDSGPPQDSSRPMQPGEFHHDSPIIDFMDILAPRMET